jgi:multidrug efflux pump subunit AcrA (membrane-fusion protein)
MIDQSTETRVHMRRYAAVLLFVAVASCSRDGGSDSATSGQQDAPLPAVEIVQVMHGSLPLEERLSGSVRARNQTEIYTEVSGTIENVFVDGR